MRVAYNLLNDRPWSEGVVEDMVVGGAIGFTLGAAAPTLVARGGLFAARAAQTSGAVAAGAGAAARAGVDANKLNHIFGKTSHNLGGLVQEFGGSTTRAFNAMQQAINQHVAANNITGRFEEVVRVGSQDITIRGNVIDGAARIGTAFIRQ